MKKVLFLLATVMLCNLAIAQDKLFLIVELMKVDNAQEASYAETEAFWEKIHQQRVNNGDILGWDLWSLRPGGENQGYQYATVTLFGSKAAMFKGGNLMANAKAAYPGMSEGDLMKKLNSAADSRDLGVRVYMEQIATTTDDFKMTKGMVAFFDWMKVEMGVYSAYEKAEMEVFQPNHQRQVDAGEKGSWSLLRFVMPIGSDTYASHMTVNFYKDVDHAFGKKSAGPTMTAAQKKAVADGLASRDMKSVNMGILERMVRKQ